MNSALRLAIECGTKRADVELAHFEHSVRGALRLVPVGIRHHLAKHCRDDLPRHAVAIFEPAAGLGLPAGEQRIPVTVELCLIVAVHDQRYRMIARIERTGAHGDEVLPEKDEFDDLDGVWRSAWRLARQGTDPFNA